MVILRQRKPITSSRQSDGTVLVVGYNYNLLTHRQLNYMIQPKIVAVSRQPSDAHDLFFEVLAAGNSGVSHLDTVVVDRGDGPS